MSLAAEIQSNRSTAELAARALAPAAKSGIFILQWGDHPDKPEI